MRKLDSFLKETLRLHPVGSCNCPQWNLSWHLVGSVRYVDNKPFTFSNGVTLPVGAAVSLPILPVHQDESVYKNGSEFDGFRFYRMREEEGDSAKTYCVNTNLNFLTFGHGTHAWYSNTFGASLMVVLGDFSLWMRSSWCLLCCYWNMMSRLRVM